MTRILPLLFILLGIQLSASAQYRRDAAKEFERLNVKSALVLNRSLDYCPIWSQSSDTIYVNIIGDWRAFEVGRLSMIPASVQNKEVGMSNNEIVDAVDSTIIPTFDLEQCNTAPLSAEQGNIVAKIEQEGFSSHITITVDGKKYYSQRSGGEVYHSPRISPDGKYVVFVAEMNGLMLVRLPEAKIELSKVDKINNKALNAYFDKGPKGAIPYYEKSLEIDSTDACALHNLAMCQMEMENFSEGKNLIDATRKFHPNNYEADFLDALHSFIQEDFQTCEDICDKLIKEHPYYSLPYYLAATMLEKSGNKERLCEILSYGVEIHAIADDPSYDEMCNE